MYIYQPECVLVEYDPTRETKLSRREDSRLFRERYARRFDGLAPFEPLIAMANEYKINVPVLRDEVVEHRISPSGFN
jgi:hypothetical protein